MVALYCRYFHIHHVIKVAGFPKIHSVDRVSSFRFPFAPDDARILLSFPLGSWLWLSE